LTPARSLPPAVARTAAMPANNEKEATMARRPAETSAEVPDEDPIGSFTEIVQSVIEHFTAKYGTTVTITVDLEAKSPDGFDAKLVRTVKENATTLKFKTAEFEDE